MANEKMETASEMMDDLMDEVSSLTQHFGRGFELGV